MKVTLATKYFFDYHTGNSQKKLPPGAIFTFLRNSVNKTSI